MLELMIFEYEYLDWLLGSPESTRAVGVRGRTGAVEHALVTLSYRGCKATVEGSAMMPRSWPFTTYLRVQGETATLEAEDRFLGGRPPRQRSYGIPRVESAKTFHSRERTRTSRNAISSCEAWKGEPTTN